MAVCHFLSKARAVDMHVDFGGGDALMSEHFLYGAQIGAALEKMRGKGMTEGVRTDVFLYAALAAEFLYDVEYHCAG